MENTDIITQCIDLAKQCIEECRATSMLCKNLPNMKKCADLSQRCAEECEFLISTCLSNPHTNPAYYDTCSISCGVCAEECEKYDLAQCRTCAEICRKFQLTYIFKSYYINSISTQYGNAKI